VKKTVKTFSVIGIIGWGLLAGLATVTEGIGDGSGLDNEMPISFILPFIYFGICILSCFASRWRLLLGIAGAVCLGSMICLLMLYGWLPIITFGLVAILLWHGGLWLTMLAERRRESR
jgi:hypothetical protein